MSNAEYVRGSHNRGGGRGGLSFQVARLRVHLVAPESPPKRRKSCGPGVKLHPPAPARFLHTGKAVEHLSPLLLSIPKHHHCYYHHLLDSLLPVPEPPLASCSPAFRFLSNLPLLLQSFCFHLCHYIATSFNMSSTTVGLIPTPALFWWLVAQLWGEPTSRHHNCSTSDSSPALEPNLGVATADTLYFYRR